jgi:CDP-4-dehydro-6-deoxyglucose reductase
MPDPKFTKPWHGVPREQIHWNPAIVQEACIGCGTCVTGCSRLVYRYDFEHRKAVVVDPLNCMVGCTTCANTCPTQAIRFPPLSSVFALEGRPEVRHVIEDDLVARREQLAWHDVVPHQERMVSLRVITATRPGPNTLILTLSPLGQADALC